jgi:hypothetical protein
MSSTYDLTVQYSLIGTAEGQQFITVFVEGEAPLTADDSHPNFDAIVEAAQDGDPTVSDLFDVANAVDKRFRMLTERVSVATGRVYLDGDEVDDALTQLIVRFLDDGEDFLPLVRFMENVQTNPNEHSRSQLFTWLRARNFAITDQGFIIAYKGVTEDEPGRFRSLNAGQATVDGKVHTGRIPNYVGATVEMPRSEVQHDPYNACSTGLHVGTFEYAQGYARSGQLLKVLVNPRDVVSVPTNDHGDKVRVCRYYVVDTAEGEVLDAYEDVDYRPYDQDGLPASASRRPYPGEYADPQPAEVWD